jgi:hypothetical protein
MACLPDKLQTVSVFTLLPYRRTLPSWKGQDSYDRGVISGGFSMPLILTVSSVSWHFSPTRVAMAILNFAASNRAMGDRHYEQASHAMNNAKPGTTSMFSMCCFYARTMQHGVLWQNAS